MAFVVREPTRKVHITRILGTNKNGDVLPDIWLDVERFEQYSKATQSWPTNQYQQVITKFRWHDDPDNTDEYRAEDDKGTARNTVVLKVCSPDEENLDDPEEWVPVRVIKRVHLTHGDDVGSDSSQKYITEDLTAKRKVKLRRVLHYDTSIDAKAEATFEADPARKNYVAKSKDYQKDDETKDEDQYIEIEIITALIKYVSAHPQSNGTDQQVTKHLKNKYLIDETEEARLEQVGTSDKNPPYRLDPFQNIINVQWSTGEEAVLAVSRDTEISSRKGTEWDGFKTNSMTAASGLGKTVIGSGTNLVAFGKPRDGAACFIYVNQNGRDVKRGVLNDSGELVWSTVRTLAGGASSCNFAGGAFFVAHYGVGDNSLITSSFDGETFGASVNPFPGANDPSNANPYGVASNPAGNPNGGSVAYDTKNKRWVTTGAFTRWYNFKFIIHTDLAGDLVLTTSGTDNNFMSAVSTDGTSWTNQHYDQSESWGTDHSISPPDNKFAPGAAPSITCFGKGVFVAASGYKTQHNAGIPNQTYIMGIPACGVATSTNGTSWDNRRLPGAVAFVDASRRVHGGNTFCVGFFKTGGTDENGYKNGFFLAGGLEYHQTDPMTYTTKLWRSDDGLSWTLTRTEGGTKSYYALSAVKKNADPDTALVI